MAAIHSDHRAKTARATGTVRVGRRRIDRRVPHLRGDSSPPSPGDPFSIPRTALQMAGLFEPAATLAAILERAGGGIEIRTTVNLPMGSGLGTSSILAATILRALAR